MEKELKSAPQESTAKENVTEKRKPGRKLKKQVKWALVIGGLLLLVYFGGVSYFSAHYLPGTKINETDYSFWSVKQIQEEMREHAANYSLLVQGRNNGEEIISGKEIGLQYETDNSLDDIMESQNSWAWPFSLFGTNAYEIENMVSFQEDTLKDKILQLTMVKTKQAKKPQNASVEYNPSSKAYEIKKEVLGDKLNKNTTIRVITHAVTLLEDKVNLEQELCYLSPTITGSAESVKSSCEELNKCLNAKITYDFGFRKETVPREQIQEWISYEKNKVQFDEEKIREYVNALSKKYDTFGRDRMFQTVSGNELKLASGGYGWRVNRPEETKELIRNLKDGKELTRNMIYISEGYTRKENPEGGTDDIGDTYVEINLGAQHLYVIQKGIVVEESDFVSGKLRNGNGTPPGVFGITYKERNATLRGENYASEVRYWMPFNGNIGMHDADWRREFGGNIYLTNGSHGCVNLPVEKAERIYELVEKGMPVVCYYE